MSEVQEQAPPNEQPKTPINNKRKDDDSQPSYVKTEKKRKFEKAPEDCMVCQTSDDLNYFLQCGHPICLKCLANIADGLLVFKLPCRKLWPVQCA